MGIRRRTVTWFAVIQGLPGAGTGRPYLIGSKLGTGWVDGHAARLDVDLRIHLGAAALDHELEVRVGVRVAASHGVLDHVPARRRVRGLAARRDQVELDILATAHALDLADRAIGIERRRRRVRIGELALEARVAELGLEQRADLRHSLLEGSNAERRARAELELREELARAHRRERGLIAGRARVRAGRREHRDVVLRRDPERIRIADDTGDDDIARVGLLTLQELREVIRGLD